MKLFKRKNQIEEQENYEYWKDPRLDDESTYDYLAEELPSDSVGWEWYYCKCESCGKYHYLNLHSTHCFYCWSGWDSMTYVECWKCRLKDKIYTIRAKIRRKMKAKKEYCNLIKQFKKDGIKITTDLKRKIIAIVNKEIIR